MFFDTGLIPGKESKSNILLTFKLICDVNDFLPEKLTLKASIVFLSNP